MKVAKRLLFTMALATRYALLAVLSTLIPLASAQAQTQGPGMDKLEALSAVGPRPPVGYRYPLMVGAHIGFRRSLDAGERSALKWLSRLIKENPKARSYMVRWHTFRKSTTIAVLTSYNFGAAQLTHWQVLSSPPPESNVTTHQEEWRSVFVDELHAVAKRNGSMANFRLVKKGAPKGKKLKGNG